MSVAGPPAATRTPPPPSSLSSTRVRASPRPRRSRRRLPLLGRRGEAAAGPLLPARVALALAVVVEEDHQAVCTLQCCSWVVGSVLQTWRGIESGPGPGLVVNPSPSNRRSINRRACHQLMMFSKNTIRTTRTPGAVTVTSPVDASFHTTVPGACTCEFASWWWVVGLLAGHACEPDR